MKIPQEELEALIAAVVDGRAGPGDEERLGGLLCDSRSARKAYAAQIALHAMLLWRHGRVGMDGGGGVLGIGATGSAAARATIAARWRRWAVAAGILIGLGAAAGVIVYQLGGKGGGREAPSAVLAKVTSTSEVVWETNQTPLERGADVRPGAIRIRGGKVQLRFQTGAAVAVSGPAEVDVDQANGIRLKRGKVTVSVKEGHRGFTVATPQANIVDLGTRFGVDAAGGQQTDVVVFDGEVAVFSPATASGQPQPKLLRRLVAGEALRVGRRETLSRIPSIRSLGEGDDWAPAGASAGPCTISSATDNVQGLANAKYYQIVPGGLREDTRAYVDRCYEWNGVDAAGIPAFLKGADLLRTFNDDKRERDLEITLTLARPATLYVFVYDGFPVPPWLAGQGFTDTGADIGLDEGPPDHDRATLDVGPGQSIDRVFSIWKYEVRQAGAVTLGGSFSKSMYGIGATPLEPR